MLKRLIPFFGKMRANAVSSAALRGYVEYRKGMAAANGTINREMAVLSSAFTLAYQETPRRVSQKLSFTRLPEPKGRQGFVEQKQYDALASACSEPYMRTMLALAYSFGFRKAELLTLKVSDVDLLAGTIRLRTSKNGEPRQVNLTKETRHLLSACVAGKAPEGSVFTRNDLMPSKACSRHRLSGNVGSGHEVPHVSRSCSSTICAGRRYATWLGPGFPRLLQIQCPKINASHPIDDNIVLPERDLADAAQKLE